MITEFRNNVSDHIAKGQGTLKLHIRISSLQTCYTWSKLISTLSRELILADNAKLITTNAFQSTGNFYKNVFLFNSHGHKAFFSVLE